MKLQIYKIVDRGIHSKERVHLRVLIPAKLTYYMILETVLVELDAVLSGGRLAYWFSGSTVYPRDHIILYTGPGTDTTKKRTDGGTNYFFYWGLSRTIWNDQKKRAVLFELQNWEGS